MKVSYKKSLIKKRSISSSKDAADYFRDIWADDLGFVESVYVIALNTANNIIGWKQVSKGGVAGTVVDNKIIAKHLIDVMASSFILAHNHPSGNLKPSNQDKIATKKLKDAMDLFEIQMLDHLIMTDEEYYSFADNLEL